MAGVGHRRTTPRLWAHPSVRGVSAVLLSILSGLGFLLPVPQNPPPKPPPPGTAQIRVKTELIQVRAVVTDSKGNPVDNLRQEDFLLLDDGQPQTISFFSVERIARRGAPEPPSKTPEPARPAHGVSERSAPARSIAVVVDTVHATHISLWNVKQAVMKFVNEQLTDKDWVALITTSRSLGVFEQFTQDRDVLRTAIRQIRPWRMRDEQQLLTPALASRIIMRDPEASCIGDKLLPIVVESHTFVNREVDCHKIANYKPTSYLLARSNQILQEAAFARRTVASLLSNVAERMAELPGQRLIAFFSDGFSMAGTAGEMAAGDLKPVIGKAVASGVIFYTFDSKGVQPLMLSAAANAYLPSQFSLTEVSQVLGEEKLDNQQALGTLAGETGGEAALGTDLGNAMRRMLDANSHYYDLAYYPPKGGDAAKFRTISVAVKDHPDYHVRAQRGYTPADLQRTQAAGPAPQDKLRSALLRLIPVQDLEVTASAEPLPSLRSESQVMLNLRVRGEILRSGQEGGRVLPELRLQCIIIDRAGRLVDTFTSKMAEFTVPSGSEIPSRFDVPYGGPIPIKPGIYHIRIGVEDTRSSRVGTAHTWVDVPDLRNGNMAVGQVILSSTATGEPKQAFGPEDRVMYQFRVYAAAAEDAVKDLTVQLQVFRGEDRVRSGAWQPLAPHVKSHDDAGWIVSGVLESSGLPAGVLQLLVTVKSAHPSRTDRRSAYFELHR